MGLFDKLFKSSSNISEKSFCYNNNGFILDGFKDYGFEQMQDDDKLINEGYVSNTDVYAVIKKLCEVSSTVPFVVKSYDSASDEWVIDEDSALNNLLEKPKIVTGKHTPH